MNAVDVNYWVVQRSVLLPDSKKVLGSNQLADWVFPCFAHFSLCLHGFSPGPPGFLRQSEDM